MMPNVAGFRLGHDGQLTPVEKSTIEFPAGRGPARVEVSPDGQTLAVASGFQGEDANAIHSCKVVADGTLKDGAGSPATPKGESGRLSEPRGAEPPGRG